MGNLRVKWVALQDAVPSEKDGWLKAQFSSEKKEVKYFFVLCSDVLYYYKNAKKQEKNMGRILVDSTLEIQLKELGKKKYALVLTNWVGDSVQLLGGVEDLGKWNSALLDAKSADLLNLKERFYEKSSNTQGYSTFCRDPETYSFPVRFPTAVKQGESKMLLCVYPEGLKVLSVFLEDVLVEVKWPQVVSWQLSRNEVIEITLLLEKKKVVVIELVCLAWVQASVVFNTLELVSKKAGATPTKAPPKSPRTSLGGPRK
jgi:hypothetical protein